MSLNFNTDIRSKKINEIKENSETFFLFYDSKIKIQLRVSTNSKIHYNDSFSKKAWQDTKLSSRKCYLTNNPPSSSLKNQLMDCLIISLVLTLHLKKVKMGLIILLS